MAENLLDGGHRDATVDEDGGARHSSHMEGEVLADVQPFGESPEDGVAPAVDWQGWEEQSARGDEVESLATEHSRERYADDGLGFVHSDNEPLLSVDRVYMVEVSLADIGVSQPCVATEQEGTGHQ